MNCQSGNMSERCQQNSYEENLSKKILNDDMNEDVEEVFSKNTPVENINEDGEEVFFKQQPVENINEDGEEVFSKQQPVKIFSDVQQVPYMQTPVTERDDEDIFTEPTLDNAVDTDVEEKFSKQAPHDERNVDVEKIPSMQTPERDDEDIFSKHSPDDTVVSDVEEVLSKQTLTDEGNRDGGKIPSMQTPVNKRDEDVAEVFSMHTPVDAVDENVEEVFSMQTPVDERYEDEETMLSMQTPVDKRYENVETMPSMQTPVDERYEDVEETQLQPTIINDIDVEDVISTNTLTDEIGKDQVTEPWEDHAQRGGSIDGLKCMDRLSLTSPTNYDGIISNVPEDKDGDTQSTDSQRLQIVDTQHHKTTENWYVEKILKVASDEGKSNILQDEVVAVEPDASQEVQSNGINEIAEDVQDGMKTQAELDCEELVDQYGDLQVDNHQTTTKKTTGQINSQNKDEEEEEEALGDRILIEQSELKMQIKSLQQNLDTLMKENNDKDVRIVCLEGDILEMAAKLKPEKEQKCAINEASPKLNISKSKTCSLL